MVNNTVKLVAQDLQRGDLAVDGNMYVVRTFARAAVLLKGFLDQAAIAGNEQQGSSCVPSVCRMLLIWKISRPAFLMES